MPRAVRPILPKEVVVEKDGNVLRLKIPMGLAATLRGRNRRPAHYNPFALPEFPPGVKPAKDSGLAMDDSETINQTINWGAATTINSAYAEGQVFLGYAQLSMLAQRPEYRKIFETIATEATREWIKLKSTGIDDKAKKISELNHLMGTYSVQSVSRKMVEGDGSFGRGHIYIALKDKNGKEIEDRDELMHSIGNGRDKTSREKVTKGTLLAFRNVEAVWCYPTDYNSTNPLAADWYKPKTWHAMGISLDKTRLLTIVSREVPDIIKPTYSFGGLSLTQMCKPYVDNFLRTRQSVSDLVHSFSVSGIKTNLQSLLTPGGQDLIERIDFFNATRDNAGAMLLDKDTEEWFNVTTPLSTLDALQSQSQEQMASVAGIPIVKLLGITPSGLNASSDGEIRMFYDAIHAFQESALRAPIQTMLGFIQLSEWGEVDSEIDFDFNSLWQLDEAGDVGVEKSKTDIDDANVAMGSVSPEEVRQRLAKDGKSIYHGLDLSIPLPDPDPIDPNGEIDPNDPHEENADVPKPRDPSDRLSSVTSRAAKQDIMSGDAAFEEGKHPRDESGKFGLGSGGGAFERKADASWEFGSKIVTKGTYFDSTPFPIAKGGPHTLRPNKYEAEDKAVNAEVPVKELHVWQNGVDGDKIRPLDDDYDKEQPIKVAQIEGQLVVMNGNHRAVSAFVSGVNKIRVKFTNFDDPKNKKYWKDKNKFQSREPLAAKTANDAATFTKKEVEYKCPSKGDDYCAACVHFKDPAACELVAGDIDPDGWCEEFETSDNK